MRAIILRVRTISWMRGAATPFRMLAIRTQFVSRQKHDMLLSFTRASEALLCLRTVVFVAEQYPNISSTNANTPAFCSSIVCSIYRTRRLSVLALMQQISRDHRPIVAANCSSIISRIKLIIASTNTTYVYNSLAHH